jgi:predicted site-specific integrase-resolvase
MRLSKRIKVVGISKTTAWRWRKDGKLKVVFRYGKAYVTADTIQKFFTGEGTAPQQLPCRRTSSAGT